MRRIIPLFAVLVASCDRSPTPAEPTSPTVSETPALVDIAATSAWTTMAPMPTARGAFAIGVMNNSAGTPIVYVAGGSKGPPTPLNVVEAYNPASNTWARKAPMPVGLWGQDGIGAVGNKLYMVGGWRWDDGSPEGGVFEYTPATNTWRTVQAAMSGNPPGHPSGEGAVGVIGGQLYVFTGNDDFYYRVLDRYNPVTATWTPLKKAPHEHWRPGGGVIGGKLYVVGGDGQYLNGITGILDVYDPGTGTWTTKAPMPTPRHAGASVVLNGKLYVIGGRDTRNADLRTVEAYDPVTNKWSTGVPMPVARASLGAAAVTTSSGTAVAYVVGGFTGTTASNQTWLYDPTVPNKPPVAVSNGPYAGTIGQPVQFSAKGTYDPEGPWGGTWTFGDGTSYTGTFGNFATQNPTHTYTKAGTFAVTFKVTDEGGLSSTASTTASIWGAGTLALWSQHVCMTTPAGKPYCWGLNNFGQLGVPTSLAQSAIPVAVAGGTVFKRVVVGTAYSCGLTSAGTVYCWGHLGGSATVFNYGSIPKKLTSPVAFASVAAGTSSVCGLTASGAAYCWGYDTFGALGGPAPGGYSEVPVAVSGGYTFTQIAVGSYNTCGVLSTGQARCWGYNNYGQLGDGTTTSRSASAPVAGGLTFASIAIGGSAACGLTPAGAAYCWGYNGNGSLGNNSTVNKSTPVAVSGGHLFSQIVPGAEGLSWCALDKAGVAWCWGMDGASMGTGNGANLLIPTKVLGGHVYLKIGAGTHSYCASEASGKLWCWGINARGQVGNGSFSDLVTQPVVVVPPAP